VLALVTGGIRDLAAANGRVASGVRVQVPVSLHRPDERPDQLGNRDSYFFVDLPVAQPDPVKRLLSVNAETQAAKAHHDAEALHALPLHGLVAHRVARPGVFSFAVSNVPGPRAPVAVAGARVPAMYSVAEISDHHALRVSAFSVADRFCFGVNADREAVPEVDVFAAGIEREAQELLALVPAG
jgi:hypothetical protein